MAGLIVNFTPTGMMPSKKTTPHVPITIAEIVEDVHRAVELGITMVHLHARDESTGEPTYYKEIYGSIIAGIRSFSPDLVICVSTSGRTFKEFGQRADVLQLDGDLKPDMGSLTLSSLNFNRYGRWCEGWAGRQHLVRCRTNQACNEYRSSPPYPHLGRGQ